MGILSFGQLSVHSLSVTDEYTRDGYSPRLHLGRRRDGPERRPSKAEVRDLTVVAGVKDLHKSRPDDFLKKNEIGRRGYPKSIKLW